MKHSCRRDSTKGNENVVDRRERKVNKSIVAIIAFFVVFFDFVEFAIIFNFSGQIVLLATSLVFSILAIFVSISTLRSFLITGITQHANFLNREWGMTPKIKSPYSVLLGIKSNQIRKFDNIAAMLFHHINELYMVYNNSIFFGGQYVETLLSRC